MQYNFNQNIIILGQKQKIKQGDIFASDDDAFMVINMANKMNNFLILNMVTGYIVMEGCLNQTVKSVLSNLLFVTNKYYTFIPHEKAIINIAINS